MTDKPVPKGPAGPESGEDVAAATALFKQWQVYKSIIDHDCMRHREIHAAIRAYVKACYPQRFSLLDLGCGDAGGISHTFMGTPLARYTGVDASAAALQEARRQLVSVVAAVFRIGGGVAKGRHWLERKSLCG